MSAFDRSSKTVPERVLRTINNPTKNNVSAMIFSWDDARKVRAENSIAIAMLNDQDKEISPDTIHALKAYDIGKRLINPIFTG